MVTHATGEAAQTPAPHASEGASVAGAVATDAHGQQNEGPDLLDPQVKPPTEAEIEAIGLPPAPGEEPEEAEPDPRPRSPIANIVLATLAVGFTLWAAREIILPILLAGFFALVGNPIIRMLRRAMVPRALGAVLVVGTGLVLAFALGRQLVSPAAEWFRVMPQQMARLAPKLRELAKPVQEANKAAEKIVNANVTGTADAAKPAPVVRTDSAEPIKAIAAAAPKIITDILAVVLLTLFFMIFGDSLQKHALELMPSWRKKRLTLDILQSIETEMSRYIFTISIINVCLGLVLALCLYFIVHMDPQTAMFWGTVATVLNFAPYVGPLIGVGVLLVVGLATQTGLAHILLPAGIYLALHTLEGEILTPIVLGKRMAISPVLLMVGLMLFGFLWGIGGLLLAVPALVCVKILLSKLDGMEGWAKLMG